MFTGIIESTGRISNLKPSPDGSSIRLDVQCDFKGVQIGESIAVNGVCLTALDQNQTAFFVSAETMAKTALGQLKVGQTVNLERAVTPSTRLSGHMVQGHVDDIGKFVRQKQIRTENGDSYELWFSVPKALLHYLVVKGSVAINGISLTINEVQDQDSEFQVHIIPHTWNHTQLRELKVGDSVNIEVDVIAKYVAKNVERILRSKSHA